MFTSSQTEVEERVAAWNAWYREEEDGGGWDILQRRYGLSSIDAIPLYPGSEIAVRPTEPDPIIIKMPLSSETRVEKGLAVRLALVTALDQTDRRGIQARADAKCVLIDGSGAFAFDNLMEICDLLFNKSSELSAPASVVLGRRPEGDSGMSEARRAIEHFEHFVLLQSTCHDGNWCYSSINLPPDGQAGCWGLSAQFLSLLPLSAPGYEIEIDLFSSAIIGGVFPQFTRPLAMGVRGSSSAAAGAVQMSIEKMEFIEQKLKLSRRTTHSAWMAFHDAHPSIAANIPDDYIRRIESRAGSTVRASPTR